MKKDNYRHRITIRMDDVLYNKICNGAKASMIPQVEFARRLLTKGKVTVKQEIIADVPELKRLIAEFGKIGSNLNQIAWHYNSGGSRSREMYDRTQRAISELYAMKYEVEKMGGDFRGYSQARLRKKQ
ncbi:MAG: plasmid mobilization relaxosome protein MobC [Clostridiales bacterium]|nr:plasmid mobilization relaxosome protein MobC [Clostridiales bacterium]